MISRSRTMNSPNPDLFIVIIIPINQRLLPCGVHTHPLKLKTTHKQASKQRAFNQSINLKCWYTRYQKKDRQYEKGKTEYGKEFHRLHVKEKKQV